MFNIILILAAFGGGAFGALIGAIPAFIFTGVMGLLGVVEMLAKGPGLIVPNIAFGTLFGPHIAFAGGVAAAAFAANKKNNLDGGMNIVVPLLKTKDDSVILVGGIFGILGYIINALIASTGLKIDTVAFTVVASGLIARLAFGKTGIIGRPEDKSTRTFFNSNNLGFNILWSLSLGIVISYLVNLTQINILGFCISASSLIFLQMGLEFPVTHHISLVAGYATIASGNIFIGAVAAVIAWFVGNAFENTFNSHCDTHIDPPAGTIMICSFIIFAIFH